jgi:hypothetical protein
MLEKIISGGQTGADQAAWRAAQAFGIATGGAMPQGFLTEDGPRPEFAERFGAVALPTEVAEARTIQNVVHSDATLWFGDTTTSGAHATVGVCQPHGKPCMVLYPGASFEPSHVVSWIGEGQFKTLNVAGNRESHAPGIGELVYQFLCDVFSQLAHKRVGG